MMAEAQPCRGGGYDTDWTKWIGAARLRTLPLSSSGVALAGGLAAANGYFRLPVFLLSILTAVFLQILSNFANDYGDAVKGSDGPGRAGPQRAVASGAISGHDMLLGIGVMVCLCVFSAIILLAVSFQSDLAKWLVFMVLCFACVAAAMLYTMGKHPYGYVGLGDPFVFIFFGLVAVLGAYALYGAPLSFFPVLPACATGCFATAVLNINNIRDMDNDRKNGKKTLAIRLGPSKARLYHLCLAWGGLLCWLIWCVCYGHWLVLIFLPVALPLLRSAWLVYTCRQTGILDDQLRITSVSSGLFNLCMTLAVAFL